MNELERQLFKVILINRLLGTNAAISEQDTQKAVEILEGKHVRVLKGYSKEERKELEEAKDSNFSSAIALIRGIGDADGDCHALSEKYYHEDTNEDNQLARDIADFYCGNAKFPEQKYYVHLIKDDKYSYLKTDVRGEVYLDSNFEYGIWKTKFTRDEVIAIDPRLVPFMEEVEK